MVAGEGKRLQPYTLNRPKCTVEVDGVSLLDRQLAVLKSENINNITLIGGYKFEMLRSYNLKLRVNHNFFKTNIK